MNLKSTLAIITLTILLISCGRNSCDQNVDKWISDAPFALEEFRKIEIELKNNPEFVKKFDYGNDKLFLRTLDTSEYFSHYRLPLLQKWFRNGRAYISFSDGDTSVCYKQCVNLNGTAYGTIGNKRENIKKYKTGVVIVDSITLKGNWFGIVTTCENCAN